MGGGTHGLTSQLCLAHAEFLREADPHLCSRGGHASVRWGPFSLSLSPPLPRKGYFHHSLERQNHQPISHIFLHSKRGGGLTGSIQDSWFCLFVKGL